MSYERRLDYLHRSRILYRRLPVKDKPTSTYEWGWFYEQGTRECYDLFRSKAKINTYKSLKWHLLVLWYLNPKLDPDNFLNLSKFICNIKNGFVTFTVNDDLLNKIVYEISMCDLEQDPSNKTRKVIFNYNCKLDLSDKLSIVGQLVGRSKKITESDIYDVMLYINDCGDKITVANLAKQLNCTPRTIYRNMTNELKKEKELLNNGYEKVQHSELRTI